MELIAKQPWVATSTDGGIALPADGPVDARALLRQLHAQDPALRARPRRHHARARDPRRRRRCRRASCGSTIAARSARAWRPTSSSSISRRIRDKATFFEPHQHSEGIDFVFVNGVAVVDGGKLTNALPGKILTR